MPISQEARIQILELVRRSVEDALAGRPVPDAPPTDADPVLVEPRGAFVTVHKNGALRGCIGQIEGRHPLWETVARMARSAAFDDPRFPPVDSRELDALDFEVSVLSPVQAIDDPESVVVGTHGLIVERNGIRGLLLPQVPVEQGWTREVFLDHTCLKAGLPPSAWKDPQTKLSVFSAEVFGEE